MLVHTAGIRQRLQAFDFTGLLIEELGWDRFAPHPLKIAVNGVDYTLPIVAQKRGMVICHCLPGPDGRIPDHATRRRIDREAAKYHHEHVIIYTDEGKTTQVWQWVRREAGKPDTPRARTYHRGQSGESLVQALRAIA